MIDTTKFLFNNLQFEGDVYVARIPICKTADQLMNEIYVKLKFPPYFGFNWNALDECISDLTWIDTTNIVITHDELPQMCETDQVVYLKILSDAIDLWRCDELHKLTVQFPSNSKDKIEQVVSSVIADGRLSYLFGP